MFQFIPHLIDTDLPDGYYAQTVLADLDIALGYLVGSVDLGFDLDCLDRWTLQA